jgi:hypothetical protein
MERTARPVRRPQRRALLAQGAVPLGFLVFALLYPARGYHWDTLERAYLLDHAGSYLRSTDGSPRSLFLSFAHVLELPLAWIVGLALPGASGLRTLVVFEALLASGAVALLGWLVRLWRGDGAGSWRAVLFAQATLAGSFAFWKMGSSGEEKILALATALLFLAVFWRALGREGPRPAWPVALAFAGAILSHLANAVLLPFAVLVAPPWSRSAERRRVGRAVAAGAIAAGLAYWLVAGTTTGAFAPRPFFDYLTFFHRAGGNNFFEPTGTPSEPGSRLGNVIAGFAAFFAGDGWAGRAAVVVLAAMVVLPAWRWRASGGQRMLRRHAGLLCSLWALHFAFFEPRNYESWVLPATLLVLAAGAALPARRAAWAALALPAFLLVVDARHYRAHHRPMALEDYCRVVARETTPDDIVVLVGGLQGGKPLRGSISMRYFLATLPDRTYASLYDVMGVTDRDYWPRPFASPAALQAALVSGRRAFVPEFLAPDVRRANESGLVHITTIAHGDSLLEITRIEAR